MSKSIVQIVERGQGFTPELWIGVIDAQGTFKPLSDTGPLRMPLEWSLAYFGHRATDGVPGDSKTVDGPVTAPAMPSRSGGGK